MLAGSSIASTQCSSIMVGLMATNLERNATLSDQGVMIVGCLAKALLCLSAFLFLNMDWRMKFLYSGRRFLFSIYLNYVTMLES